MYRLSPMQFFSSQTTASVYVFALALLLLTGGCDFGAAQRAVDSMGVIVELAPIETTVSGQAVDAATGELVETPLTLRFKGADGNAVVDMYSDPLSSQQIEGGLASFGIQNGRQPSSNAPVRLRVVATAEGYQPTSEVIEIHAPGTKQFTLDLLSENPRQQPEGTSSVRDRSGEASDGNVAKAVTVETSSEHRDGRAGLHIPSDSRLETAQTTAEGQLTIDLSHYPPTDATMDALPANGTIETNNQTERFGVVGYLNLRIRDESGEAVSRITNPGKNKTHTQTTVRLPADAVHPSTGDPLQEGDELELFRYDADAGTWHPDTTVTVQSLNSSRQPPAAGGPNLFDDPDHANSALGFNWRPMKTTSSRWWAWGSRSKTSCKLETTVQIEKNGQAGSVAIALERPGRKYSNTKSLDALSETTPMSTLLGKSSVPCYQDYELTAKTRDGQTRTIGGVDPSNGTVSMTLPESSSIPRTDALFRGHPECPGDQKVRITSVPTLTIYYRSHDAPTGATWHTAGDDKIKWVMDDPDNPTYIKYAELRLDGLEQDTRYDMYTTYDGDRYEGTDLVPARDTATIEEDRVVVPYSQDFSDVCS